MLLTSAKAGKKPVGAGLNMKQLLHMALLSFMRSDDMEILQKRLGNLLAVKSIVTIVLTAVFAYLTCTGGVTADQFLTVFTVVIAFYFGTQAEKKAQQTNGDTNG